MSLFRAILWWGMCATILAMRRWLQWLLLAIILLLALALRWTGLDWDDYHHYHPDERYITWVATSIEWPSTLRDALAIIPDLGEHLRQLDSPLLGRLTTHLGRHDETPHNLS